jgi:hypothetical protein
MQNFPRYDERFTGDLWAALRLEFHSRRHGCYNKLKLENKIEFKNYKTGKNVAKANTTPGQNRSENPFFA